MRNSGGGTLQRDEGQRLKGHHDPGRDEPLMAQRQEREGNLRSDFSPIPSPPSAAVGLGAAGPHPGEPTHRDAACPRPSVPPKGRCALQGPSGLRVSFQQAAPGTRELRGAGKASKLSHLLTQFPSACQKLFRPQMTGLEAA